MKKTLSIVLSLIIAFSMMFTFVGCGSDDDSGKKDTNTSNSDIVNNKNNSTNNKNNSTNNNKSELSDSEIFIGEWECELDMTDYMNEYLAADDEIGDYITISDFSMVMNFKFTKDTLKITLDEDALLDAFDKIMKKDFKKGLEKYMEDMLEEYGIDMSVDEFLATEGLSIDDLLDDIMEEFLSEDSIDEAFGDFETVGEYKVKNGKLYSDEDGDFDDDEYITYKIVDEDTIKLTGTSEDLDDEEMAIFEMLFPLVLERK